MEYEYEVCVDDSWMAGGSAKTPQEAVREADHYAMMYSSDGNVKVSFFLKMPVSSEDMRGASAS